MLARVLGSGGAGAEHSVVNKGEVSPDQRVQDQAGVKRLYKTKGQKKKVDDSGALDGKIII